VILLSRWAIKFPTVQSWTLFLRGLLANMQERDFYKWETPIKHLVCPVLFCAPGGFFLLMPRCAPLNRDLTDDEIRPFYCGDGFEVPVEDKSSSFGILDGRIVAVDYGS